MFLLRRPSPRDVEAFVRDCRERPLSFDGMPPAGGHPPGFLVDVETFPLGSGRDTFARAVHAVRTWRHFDLGWVALYPPDAPVAPGISVAVCIRHMQFWSLNGARVVAVSGSEADTAYSFTYRTLTNHAECGEESFTVAWDPATDAVSYAVHAISRPYVFLTRLGFPYVRVLQARFRRHSARALHRLARRPGPESPPGTSAIVRVSTGG